MVSPVIDISHHNPTPDWAAIGAAGVVGVIHKATEGTGYVDPTLFSRASKAIAQGLCWSTYHFLRPGSMTGQMEHYLGTVDPKKGERVCLDHEDAGVSLQDLEEAVRYILDTRPDLQITLYSGHLIKEQLDGGRSAVLADNTSLWIAQYTSADAPSWPKGTWPAWSLWQWTDSETIPGIAAPVDGDRWNGDVADLPKWFGPAEEEPRPEPAPAPPEPVPATVDVAILTAGNVRVSVSLNGETVVAAAS